MAKTYEITVYTEHKQGGLDMAILRQGWGYHEEYLGTVKGNFRRATEDMPGVMIEEIGYGYPDDVLITLPNGKRGMTKLQALVRE